MPFPKSFSYHKFPAVLSNRLEQINESSYKEHIMNALVPTGDEGRDKLR